MCRSRRCTTPANGRWSTTSAWPSTTIRVADFRTDFVGDEHWGWAAWAHNEYKSLFIKTEDKDGQPRTNYWNAFQVQTGAHAANASPPADIATRSTEAKAITLRIINAIRASMKPHGTAASTVTGVAFVLVNNRVELWVAQQGGVDSPIAADRRRALYQCLTKDSVVKAYLAANKIKVELKPTTPVCTQTAKQVINLKDWTNLTAAEQAEIDSYVSADKAESEYAGLPDSQVPLATLQGWRKGALAQLNHAERHIYRQLEQESGARLLAIGSTIPMCEACEAVTVANGLQYALAVPTVSGNYLTTPTGWSSRVLN